MKKTLTNKDIVVSAASCTTNALAIVLNVLHENFKIEKGLFNTVHGYTPNQPIHDSLHKDLRRSRAGATNIIPTSTGASLALSKVIPSLKNKIEGSAMRVPVITGSIIDVVLEFDNSSNFKYWKN